MNNKKNIPNTLVIVPAYNEEDVIEKTINKLLEVKILYPNLDICVINDGSKDRTSKIVREKDIILIDLPINLGIGGAMQTGYKFAYLNNYEIAVQFDADGQHSENDLINLITPIITEEADMVIGSRFLKKTNYKGSIYRRIGISYFTFLLYLLTGKIFTDPTSGYRAKNKKAIEVFSDFYPKDYPEPEVLIYLYRKGLKLKEISVNMNERQGGISSIRSFKTIYYMVKVTLSILIHRIGRI